MYPHTFSAAAQRVLGVAVPPRVCGRFRESLGALGFGIGANRVRKVLFDENMPRKLRRDLPEFSIRTAQEQGWSSFKNGQLLARAVREFEVLVTIDQRMRYQQNLHDLSLGIVVIDTRDTRFESIRAHVEELREAIARVRPGEVILVPRTA